MTTSKRKKVEEIDDEDENEIPNRSRPQNQVPQKVYDFHKKTVEVYPERLRELNRQFATSITTQLTSEPYSVLVGNCLDYVRQYFSYEEDLLQYSPWLANRLKQSRSDIVNCLQTTIDLYEALARNEFDYLFEQSSVINNSVPKVAEPTTTFSFAGKPSNQPNLSRTTNELTTNTNLSNTDSTQKSTLNVSSSTTTTSTTNGNYQPSKSIALPTASFTFQPAEPPTTTSITTTGFIYQPPNSTSSSSSATTTTTASTTTASSSGTGFTFSTANSTTSTTSSSTTTTSSTGFTFQPSKSTALSTTSMTDFTFKTSDSSSSSTTTTTTTSTTTTPSTGFMFQLNKPLTPTTSASSLAPTTNTTSFPTFGFKPSGTDSPSKVPAPPFSFSLPTTGFGTSTFSGEKLSNLPTTSSPFNFNPLTPASNVPPAEGDADDEPSEPPAVEKVVHETDAKLTYNCRMGVTKSGKLTKRGPVQVVIKGCNEKNQMIVRSDDSLGRLFLNIIWSKNLELKKNGTKDLTFVCQLNPAMPEIKEGEFVTILFRFDSENDRNDAFDKFEKERS